MAKAGMDLSILLLFLPISILKLHTKKPPNG